MSEMLGRGAVIKATGLHKRFIERSGETPLDVHVLQGVDLEVARMQNGLIEFGYQVEVLTVLHSVKEELGRHPRYSPDKWLVVNWCEQYIDRPWTDAEIAQELEDLGYVFTGASGSWH